MNHFQRLNEVKELKIFFFAQRSNTRKQESSRRPLPCDALAPTVQSGAGARSAQMTRQRAEDQQLYNRMSLTSRAHRGSLYKRRELVLSSFASSELSFAFFSACLSVLFLQVIRVFALPSSRFSLVVGLLAPSDRSCCAVQLVFSFLRLPFPLSRRATLRMRRPTTRSTSRSSRSSQPPTSNNDEPPSRSEPSPSPSSSQPPSAAPEWFTQALGSLQNQLAETRSAASEAVAATQMLSTEVRQLKRSSATGSAPPPKLPKLSKPGLAAQEEFNAGKIQAMENALSTHPVGSEEAAKYLQEGKAALSSRQNTIRIADKFNWDTVAAYSEGLVGDNAEDDRRIAGAAALARRLQPANKPHNYPFRGPRSLDTPASLRRKRGNPSFFSAPTQQRMLPVRASGATGHERAPNDGKPSKARRDHFASPSTP